MPTVPGYETPDVNVRPLAGVEERSIASPELFGAGARQMSETGRAFSEAGRNVTEIGIDIQRRENAAKLFTAESAALDEWMPVDQELRQTRGLNAIGSTKKATEAWAKIEEKYAGTLDNDVQRQLFKRSTGDMRRRSLNSISQHEAEQQFTAVADGAKASAINETNFAAAHANDPALVMQAKQRGADRIDAGSKLLGDAPETAEAKRADYLTNFHKQIIQSLVGPSPDAAKAYFDANKEEIAGMDRESVENLLKTGAIRKTSQDTADYVMGKGMSEAEGIAYVRSKYSGEEEEQGVIEVKTRFHEGQAARENSQKNAADQAFQIYAKAGRLSAIPAATWNAMDGQVQLSLKKQAQLDAQEKDAVTNWDRYYQLRTIAKADPDFFKDYDLRKDFGQLGKAQRESLIDLQSKASDPKKIASVRSLDSQIAASMAGQLSGDDAKIAEDKIREAINAEQQRTDKEMNETERQKFIDRMLMQGEVLSGHFYMNDPNKRVYQVSELERKQFQAFIPNAQRQQIISALKAKGRPVTEDSIIDLYESTKRRGAIK